MPGWLKWIDRTVSRAGEIFFSAVLFPLVLPQYLREDGSRTKVIGALLGIPGFIVALYAYLYLVMLAVTVLGVPEEYVGMFRLGSLNPKDFFDTFFFSLFFPIMAFYLYAVRTDRVDWEQVRDHFREHIPTKAELLAMEEERLAAEEEKRKVKEKNKRILSLLRKLLPWTIGILLAVFLLANYAAEGATPWGGIVFISLFFGTMIAALFAFAIDDRRERKKARGERKRETP